MHTTSPLHAHQPPGKRLSLMLGLPLKHLDLLRQLIRREIEGRYRGSALGLLWSVLTPLILLAVYTFVFGVVFRARWGVETTSSGGFAIVLFAGLLVFNLFAECLTRAPHLITGNPMYVKKVVFPLEVLPLVSLGVALFHYAVGLVLLLIACAFQFGSVPWTALLLPFVLLPLCFFTLGVSWLLASLGVFLRDLAHVIALVSTVLMFLSPIFYPLESIPPHFRTIVLLNPLSWVVEATRGVLIFKVPFAWDQWCLWFVGSIFFAWICFVWFQKTRKGFADVL